MDVLLTELTTVDAQMIQDTARFSMSLVPSLERTLSGKVKPMMTQCSIRHLYALPSSDSQKESLIAAAKTLERRRCNHHTLEQPLSTFECLSSVVDPKSASTQKDLVNKFNYVVAVQDEEVRRWCRGVRGVPLVYVKRSVMVMEPMAEGSTAVREGVERGKFRSGLRGRTAVQPGKRKREEEVRDQDNGAGVEGGEREKKTKKVQGAKGPNPLSVKKPKKEMDKAGRALKEDEHVIRGSGESGVGNVEAEDVITSDIREVLSETENQSAVKRRKRKHRSKKPEALEPVVNGSGGEE
ncbi:MAG: hypothetical protein Q9164_003837 [Protoblastenia rupestris]